MLDDEVLRGVRAARSRLGRAPRWAVRACWPLLARRMSPGLRLPRVSVRVPGVVLARGRPALVIPLRPDVVRAVRSAVDMGGPVSRNAHDAALRAHEVEVLRHNGLRLAPVCHAGASRPAEGAQTHVRPGCQPGRVT